MRSCARAFVLLLLASSGSLALAERREATHERLARDHSEVSRVKDITATVLKFLGVHQDAITSLAKGECPAKLGNKETFGLGCKHGCTCARMSFLKSCYEGGTRCDAGAVATAALTMSPSDDCVAMVLGECKIAMWVYIAGPIAGVLLVGVPIAVVLLNRKPSS
mmetsp:Transcript_35751/g.83139  ORF Transcript_35751/g.83139 Transcript_35751/m.83139 type:complete len:164 (-) Transcript_35751:242-733(-)